MFITIYASLNFIIFKERRSKQIFPWRRNRFKFSSCYIKWRAGIDKIKIEERSKINPKKDKQSPSSLILFSFSTSTIKQIQITMYPLCTNNWWSKLLCLSSIGFPLTDITFSFGFDAIVKITGPDKELLSAQNNSKCWKEPIIHWPPTSVVSVYDISRFLRLGSPFATISIPESPILFPLISNPWMKSRLFTIILHEREVRKLFLA